MKIVQIGNKFENQKFDFRETCFGICVKDEKILLTYKKNKNETSLVGGGIETDENFEQCLKREFVEEVGYEITSINQLCSIDCYWLAGGKWPMRSLANVFIVDIDKQCQPTEKGCESVWVDLVDVEKYLSLPYQKEAINQYKMNLLSKSDIDR